MTHHKNTIFMLGKTGAGRATFFTNTELGYEKDSSALYTTWENEKTRYLIPKQVLTKANSNELFEQMYSYCAVQPFQLALITIDFPTLLDDKKRDAVEKLLVEQLSLIKKCQKKLMVSIVITKCDRLLGFQEFFNNLTIDERKQAFGVTRTDEFSTFLQTLNSQVITRLHQESLPEKRTLIQMFPTQLELLTTKITLFVEAIGLDDANRYQGIHFTSNKQKHKPIDILNRHKNTLPPSITDKVFFTEDLLNQFNSIAANNKIKAKRFDKKRWAIIPISLVIVIALILSWHISYENTTRILTQVQMTLKQKIKATANEPLWLTHLNINAKVLQKLNAPAIKYGSIIGFSQANSVRKKITLIYNTQLQTQYLPYIEGILTNTMVQSMQHNKLQLYNTLKIYLMLATHDHYDANTILNWFALYWQHTDPKNDALQKMQRYHLQQVLALSNTTWPQNKPLIAQAKSLLNALPPADIAFLELQGLYKNKQQSLATMLENHDDIDLSHAIIPSLFSSNNFKTVYNDQIPDLVKTLNQVNWVIGRATPKQPNPQHQAQLISSVRALYLTYFSKNWSAMVNHIDLKQPENFTDVQSLINEMTNPQSELMNLLSFISGNAALDKTAKPTANITLINQFLAKGDAYKQSKANMTHLSIYLKTIVASDNPNKASYNVVTSLLNNPQQSNPLHDLLSQPTKDASPILKWQLTIAKGSLHILLNHAKTYLNSVWDSTAFPDYNSNIENRYPVFSDSTEDTDVDTFSKFFAPNGTLDVFFNYYMKPFVNMNSNYWTWQTVYGVKLDMPQSTLDTFMRASLIQQMFFTDNHDSASFRFSLTPFAKSAAAQSVTLIIDGQTQHSSDHSHSSNILTWPGPKPGNAAITVQLQKGKPITQSFAGPWALFRLLAFAKITPTTNPQKYIVQFKLGEQTITYHMIMDNKVNPFLPGVLDRFRASANPF